MSKASTAPSHKPFRKPLSPYKGKSSLYPPNDPCIRLASPLKTAKVKAAPSSQAGLRNPLQSDAEKNATGGIKPSAQQLGRPRKEEEEKQPDENNGPGLSCSPAERYAQIDQALLELGNRHPQAGDPDEFRRSLTKIADMHFDGSGRIIQRPGHLHRGGGGHQLRNWRVFGPNGFVHYLNECIVQERARARQAWDDFNPYPYLRQAYGVGQVIGSGWDMVASMLHLWAVLRFNLRERAQVVPSLADYLSLAGNRARREQDRAIWKHWGVMLAHFLQLPSIPQNGWQTAAEEKTWIHNLANQLPPQATESQVFLFSCPLFTCERLADLYILSRQAYSQEIEAMDLEHPDLDPTDRLEMLSANLPVWLTRKIVLHASHRVPFDTAAGALLQGINRRTDENCQNDPWFHMVACATTARPALRQLVTRLRATLPFLESSLGRKAPRMSCPYAQCNLCMGRGHGQSKGCQSKKSRVTKEALGLRGAPGTIALLKRAQQLEVARKGKRADVYDVVALQSLVGQGCIVGPRIWDQLEVAADAKLQAASNDLREKLKRLLRPPQVDRAANPFNGLGVPEIYVNGRSRSTRDMQNANAALELPGHECWLTGNKFGAACQQLYQGGTCDRWNCLAVYILGLFLQKRCLWCNGGGHYWYQCAHFQDFSQADWASNGQVGIWLRPQILYHTPRNVTARLMGVLADQHGITQRMVRANQQLGANAANQVPDGQAIPVAPPVAEMELRGRNFYPSGGFPYQELGAQSLPAPIAVQPLPPISSLPVLAPAATSTEASDSHPADSPQLIAARMIPDLTRWARNARQHDGLWVQQNEARGLYQSVQFYPSDDCFDDAQWYLAIVPPLLPVEEPAAYEEWARGLADSLYNARGPYVQQLFVWKWGRSIVPSERISRQGLVPVFLLKPSGACMQSAASKFETKARHILRDLAIAVPDQPEESRLRAAYLFPSKSSTALALFAAMCKARWLLTKAPLDAQPAYTEMFVATPAAVRYWASQLQVLPQWNSFQPPAASNVSCGVD